VNKRNENELLSSNNSNDKIVHSTKTKQVKDEIINLHSINCRNDNSDGSVQFEQNQLSQQ